MICDLWPVTCDLCFLPADAEVVYIEFLNKIGYASINSKGAHTSPPPGNRRAFAQVVSPGVGQSQFYSDPRGWSLAYTGANPGNLTHAFTKDGWYEFIGKDEAFVKSGTRKNLLMFLKVFFVNFRYFFITCKHFIISDKVNYILAPVVRKPIKITRS